MITALLVRNQQCWLGMNCLHCFVNMGHRLLRDTGTSTVYCMFTQNTRPLQDTVMFKNK